MGAGTGEVRLDFAGEERPFRIRWGEIRRIEDKCDTGIGEVLRRLSRAVLVLSKLEGLEALAAGLDIRAQDVREVIYQGLRGANMPDQEAVRLLRTELDDRGIQGLIDNAPVALGVLWGSQSAPEADQPGEREAGATSTPASEPTSPPSSGSAPPSASAPGGSKSSRRGSSTPRSKDGGAPTSPTAG